MTKTNTENVDPGKVKWWITLIIAILTAIAGSLCEAKTGVLGAAFNGTVTTINTK